MDDVILGRLLECIASGLTVSQTRDAVAGGADIPLDELLEARKEALAQGIEREDIAPSWLALS